MVTQLKKCTVVDLFVLRKNIIASTTICTRFNGKKIILKQYVFARLDGSLLQT